MKICIDPGHSGPFEPGSCAAGVTEAAVNLQVSKTLAKMLEGAGHTAPLIALYDPARDPRVLEAIRRFTGAAPD